MCPVGYSDTKVMTWMRWEQQVRGNNMETGETTMWEFMEEF